MVTKSQLLRYLALRAENENRLERLARMRSAAELPPMAEGDGSMHTNSSGDRMARAVENCMEYEEQIRPLIASNTAEMQRIEQAVDALDDPLEREVIRLRYMTPAVDEETGCDSCRWPKWSVIAERIYGNPYERGVKAAQKLNRIAIDKLTNSS